MGQRFRYGTCQYYLGHEHATGPSKNGPAPACQRGWRRTSEVGGGTESVGRQNSRGKARPGGPDERGCRAAKSTDPRVGRQQEAAQDRGARRDSSAGRGGQASVTFQAE
eukprot:2363419-Rhodomonas_salina.1